MGINCKYLNKSIFVYYVTVDFYDDINVCL
jgi:hypothetical protein